MPVIVAGDFNEEPQNQPIKGVMESSFIDLYTQVMLQMSHISKTDQENHQNFTTFKYRNESGFVKRTIDYMFLADNDFYQKNGVTVKEYIDMADYESYGYLNQETGSPSRYQPSDHYSLAYKVQFSSGDAQSHGDEKVLSTIEHIFSEEQIQTYIKEQYIQMYVGTIPADNCNHHCDLIFG